MQAMPPRVVVTTSWDDEDRSGLRLAGLLQSCRLPGTFYVPTGRLGSASCLTPEDLRRLNADGFEIGAHTVSHAILPTLGPRELAAEVGECKEQLQQILGREVPMFCYPKGRFSSRVTSAVRRAGYRGARTTRMLASSGAFYPFALPVTIQAFPHRPSNYIRNLVRLGSLPTLLRVTPDLLRFEDWSRLGKLMFDRVVKSGGVWHLYGHSWEIEKLNLWAQLEDMFEYVANRSGVIYATNGQLLSELGATDSSRRDNVASVLPS